MDHSPRTDDQLEDMQRKLAFARGCADTLDFTGLLHRTSALFFKWAQSDVVALILPPAAEGQVPTVHVAGRQPILGEAEQSIREECAVLLAELELDAGIAGDALQLVRGPELLPLHAPVQDRSLYRVWSQPLEVDGEIVGVLALLAFTHWILSPRTRRLLGGVVPMLAEAVRTAAAVEHLRARAVEDALTGVRNQRGFEDALIREAARARATGRPLSMLLVDVDDFRAMNQRCGREVGDLVLREVARSIEGELRDFDIVARVGGDEFAVLLPEMGVHDAERVGSRLADAVSRIVHTDGTRISLSIGVAGDEGEGLAPETLFERADVALYDARRSGPGRVGLTA